jgi:hypothetical protein
LAGQVCNRIGRFNADGSLDSSFNPGANAEVDSILVQADGRILVAGAFTSLHAQSITNLARLNSDGTIDQSFHVAVGSMLPSQFDTSVVDTLGIQEDGKILVSGNFTKVNGVVRGYFARLVTSDVAAQNLVFDGQRISWSRGGAGPEICRTSFDACTNNSDWFKLGNGTRVPGGWELTGLNLWPTIAIRARGAVTGGNGGSSCWFLERFQMPLTLSATGGSRGTTPFTFTVHASTGSSVVIESSTNLILWEIVATNTLYGNAIDITDLTSGGLPFRFYRARAH